MSGDISEVRGMIQQGIEQIEEVTSPSREAHEGMSEGNEHLRLAAEGIAAVLGHISRAKESYSQSATACRLSVTPMRESARSFVEVGANEDEIMAGVVQAIGNTRKSTQKVAGSLDGAVTYLTELWGILQDRKQTLEEMVSGVEANNKYIDGNANMLASAVADKAREWQSRL